MLADCSLRRSLKTWVRCATYFWWRLGKQQQHLIKCTSSCLSPELSKGKVKARGCKAPLFKPTETTCIPHAVSSLHCQPLTQWKAVNWYSPHRNLFLPLDCGGRGSEKESKVDEWWLEKCLFWAMGLQDEIPVLSWNVGLRCKCGSSSILLALESS